MSGTTTLILGGGFGGIVAANTLRTLLPKEHKIVLVEKRNSFHVGATKTWVMLGMRTPQGVTRSLDALKRRGIEVVQASVKSIDPPTREVVTENGALRGDYLVIALGADLNMGAVPGLEQAAQTFYTMDGAMRSSSSAAVTSFCSTRACPSSVPPRLTKPPCCCTTLSK